MKLAAAALAFLIASAAAAGTIIVQPHPVGSAYCYGSWVSIGAIGPVAPYVRPQIYSGDSLLFGGGRGQARIIVRGRCWGEALSGGAHIVPVDLWPTSAISGSFHVSPESAPKSLKAHVRTAPGEKPVLSGADVTCTIDADEWQCVVPAATLDIELKPAGYTPLNLQYVKPPAGSVLPLGSFKLRAADTMPPH